MSSWIANMVIYLFVPDHSWQASQNSRHKNETRQNVNKDNKNLRYLAILCYARSFIAVLYCLARLPSGERAQPWRMNGMQCRKCALRYIYDHYRWSSARAGLTQALTGPVLVRGWQSIAWHFPIALGSGEMESRGRGRVGGRHGRCGRGETGGNIEVWFCQVQRPILDLVAWHEASK